MKNQF
jgi:hypothetical protein